MQLSARELLADAHATHPVATARPGAARRRRSRTGPGEPPSTRRRRRSWRAARRRRASHRPRRTSRSSMTLSTSRTVSCEAARTPVTGLTPPPASVAAISARSRQSTRVEHCPSRLDHPVGVASHAPEPRKQLTDRAVAMTGLHSDRLTRSSTSSGRPAKQPVGRFTRAGTGSRPEQRRGGDRPGVDHRVRRVEQDRVERLAGRLDPDPCAHDPPRAPPAPSRTSAAWRSIGS